MLWHQFQHAPTREPFIEISWLRFTNSDWNWNLCVLDWTWLNIAVLCAALWYVIGILTSRCGLWQSAVPGHLCNLESPATKKHGFSPFCRYKVFFSICCSLLVLVPIQWCPASLFVMSIQAQVTATIWLAGLNLNVLWSGTVILLSLCPSMLDISWFLDHCSDTGCLKAKQQSSPIDVGAAGAVPIDSQRSTSHSLLISHSLRLRALTLTWQRTFSDEWCMISYGKVKYVFGMFMLC